MKASDLLTQNTPPKILIYGAGGSGKTGLVAQANNGYLFDFDNGMLTAASLKDKFFTVRNSIEFDRYRDTNPMSPTGWIKAKAKLIEFMNQGIKGLCKYDCIVIDSLTGMAEAIQNQIMMQSGKPLGKPEIQQWGLIVAELENAIQIIRSLPCLVLVTAHELPIQIDDDIVLKILAPGQKLPAKIPAWFDEVWYAKVRPGAQDKTNYIVSGRKTTSIEARTRSGMNKDICHNDIGLLGVLKEIGFTYGGVAAVKPVV